MSVTKMDAVQEEAMTFKRSEPKYYINTSYMSGVLKVLQCLRQDQVLCDIKLMADDGKIVHAHKVVLLSACPYFFNSFISLGKINDKLLMKKLNSSVLQLLVDYIYTGKIKITEENVKVLFAAANLLQLEFIKNQCDEFLKSQMDPSNCLSIKKFANLNGRMGLLSICEEYIKKHFLEVVKYSEFLSLTSAEVIMLISRDDIFVPLEEKVYECVLNWVKHDIDLRKDFFPELMAHVRLPITSKEYLQETVVNEPLLENIPECKDYIKEALDFYLHRSLDPFAKPKTIRSKPRQHDGLRDGVLVSSWSESMEKCLIKWFDFNTNTWYLVIDMKNQPAHLALISNQFVFAVGIYNLVCRSVRMLDLSLQAPSWFSTTFMLVDRRDLGVGVLDNCVYAIGGYDGSCYLNSVEVYDISIRQWRMVSSMNHKRSKVGVGALNNLLYAVGGSTNDEHLKSVECYDPSLDTWTLVAEMSICRSNVGIGVLDGVLYAIGGSDGPNTCKNVEAYTSTDGVWTTITDMHLCRMDPGVVAFSGSLIVIGGRRGSTSLNSIEIYDPKTNSWKLVEDCLNGDHINSGIVVNYLPHHFQTK